MSSPQQQSLGVPPGMAVFPPANNPPSFTSKILPQPGLGELLPQPDLHDFEQQVQQKQQQQQQPIGSLPQNKPGGTDAGSGSGEGDGLGALLRRRGFGQYVSCFEQEDVDMEVFLMLTSKSELNDIGVTSADDQDAILGMIAAMQVS